MPEDKATAPSKKGNPGPQRSAIHPLMLGPKKNPNIRVVKKKPMLAPKIFSEERSAMATRTEGE